MPIRRRKRDIKPGLPLTTADLSKARAELAECMDPGEFRRRVHGLDKRVRPDKKFNDNEYKFLREAWVLAELSKHMPFVKIRLVHTPLRSLRSPRKSRGIPRFSRPTP
jgi:hypothetical protein